VGGGGRKVPGGGGCNDTLVEDTGADGCVCSGADGIAGMPGGKGSGRPLAGSVKGAALIFTARPQPRIIL